MTGTGGAGKSSLIDELLHRVQFFNPELKLAIIALDPTKRKTGGALLGDRLRMNALNKSPNVRECMCLWAQAGRVHVPVPRLFTTSFLPPEVHVTSHSLRLGCADGCALILVLPLVSTAFW